MTEQVRLMVPGPTPLPPEVIDELSKPMIYHRGKEFMDITQNVVRILKQLFDNQDGHILVIPSSGRGAMEAALVNLFSPGDKVLAVINGYFGEVFSQIAAAFGLSVSAVRFSWEDDIDYSVVEKALKEDKNIKGIIFTHCETSNAVENDLKSIGSIAKKYGKLLIVDGVSSLGCMPLKMKEDGIDVAVTASQKGLMTPTGISIAAISPNAWNAVGNGRLPRFYFDFLRMREYIEKGQTPVSTPVPLVRALNASLKLIEQETFDKVFERHERLAGFIREEAVKMGYKLYPDNPRVKRASSLSAFSLPESIKAETVVSHISSKYNTLFAKGLGKVASQMIRVGHMGWFHEEDAVHVLDVLGKAKKDLGF